ncbi:cathepsin O-like isoform X2 [Carassius auratus]|uniref:Cathepsin O-like isoform X2 n=1 Tax=Carassius auratus TaxID=7957 RepID=A0A6P6NL91_CARAU|nr:cathepsin O-like isoform X2 [Carassius auratus]
MAFTLTLVILIIYHELLTGSNSVELLSRKYLTDGERLKTFQQGNENSQRRINFQSSLKRQAFLNSAMKKSNHSARYGINQFSDLSPQQFRERYLTVWNETAPKFDPSMSGIQVKMNYPPKFDWRDHGVVGPVRNQESTKLKLVKEADYPFEDKAGICQYFPQSHAGVAVRNYSAYDFSGHEEVMMSVLVESGPLVVIVDAISWQDYLGGIIQHHCSSHNANHAVLMTGYDTTGEVPYWIVRNSWGTSWGDDGYAYIKIGNDMCGIADNVAAVLV